MIRFLLPALAVSLYYTPYNSQCLHLNDTCANAANPAECSQVDVATLQCVDAMVESIAGVPSITATLPGIPPFDPSQPTFQGLMAAAYFWCSFDMTSLVTTHTKNMIYPELRAVYECDAGYSGIPNVAAFTEPWDAQSICMANTTCVQAHEDLRTWEGVTANFNFNSKTGWYDLAQPPTNDMDDMCSVFFALLEIQNTDLLLHVSSSLRALKLFGHDTDAIVERCYKILEEDITALVKKYIGQSLAIFIPVTFILVAGATAGIMFWWYTGCDISGNARKQPYKAEEPAV